jgi:hypothetical protein
VSFKRSHVLNLQSMFVCSEKNVVSNFSIFASQRSYSSLHCELIWAIRLAVATCVARYCDMVAPYLEFTMLYEVLAT